MIDLTCGICGRSLKTTTEHVEEFRDKGHKPRAVRELEPLKEIALRQSMTGRPGRR